MRQTIVSRAAKIDGLTLHYLTAGHGIGGQW
jgi:hypothetical protein